MRGWLRDGFHVADSGAVVERVPEGRTLSRDGAPRPVKAYM